jgi:hypothetical protein
MTELLKERILQYLWSIAPDWATNHQILEATGIPAHHQVYRLTQELQRAGLIEGDQLGQLWIFWVADSPAFQLVLPWERTDGEVPQPVGDAGLTPPQFEALARRVLGEHLGVTLQPGQVTGVPAAFDLVSNDGAYVGDARLMSRVEGPRPPAAQFAAIAERVWLLEKTGAAHPCLVFGHDRRVPAHWLSLYERLAPRIAFYFLADDGTLELLHAPES